MSGGRIDLSKFKEGWALAIFAQRAHFLGRTDVAFGPTCGAPSTLYRDAAGFIYFEAATWPRCKRCEKRAGQ